MAAFNKDNTDNLDRVQKLHEYERVVPSFEQSFGRIINIMADLLDASYVGLHFVEQNKSKVKAKSGIDFDSKDQPCDVCWLALQSGDPLIVGDLTSELADNHTSTLTDNTPFRACLGSPLISPEGLTVGILCVMDRKPNKFDEQHKKHVREFSDEIIDKLELFRRLYEYESHSPIEVDRLKEIHHRLKNNLNLITGLIDLELMRIKDSSFSKVLVDIQKRIQSVATLHRHLYEGKWGDRIWLKSYINELIEDIIEGLAESETSVDYQVTGDQLQFPHQRAIYMGLMVNELLTNTLKYAFPDKKNGKIVIDISRNNQYGTMHYYDNGLGLPEDFNIDQGGSLGMAIIQNSVAQLEGSIEFYNDNGVNFRISFPLK